METIKINSIDEVDQYIDQLRKIKVWLCHSGCGKTSLCWSDDRFFDLDYYRHHTDVEDIDEQTLNKFREVLSTDKIILDNNKTALRNYLKDNGVPYVYLRANPSHYKEYIRRLKKRGVSKDSFRKTGVKIGHYYYTKIDQGASFLIVMDKYEYLSNYLWKVFGYPQKYIQCHDFDAKQYKLVFIEMESFSNMKKISRIVKQTIKKLKNKVKIVLVGQENFVEIKPYLKKLGLYRKKNIVICNNGATVADGKGKIIKLFSDKFDIVKTINFVAASCLIPLENTIAIGEGKNFAQIFNTIDCSVLECNHYNIRLNTKQTARYWTDSCYADGAARALRKIFGLN